MGASLCDLTDCFSYFADKEYKKYLKNQSRGNSIEGSNIALSTVFNQEAWTTNGSQEFNWNGKGTLGVNQDGVFSWRWAVGGASLFVLLIAGFIAFMVLRPSYRYIDVKRVMIMTDVSKLVTLFSATSNIGMGCSPYITLAFNRCMASIATLLCNHAVFTIFDSKKQFLFLQ